MSERDTGVLVGVLGVFVFWMGASSELFRFIRPGMRPYVILAAVALIATSVASLVIQHRQVAAGGHDSERDGVHGEHDDDSEASVGHGRTKVVALIALPVVVGLFLAPGALGSWAAGRDRGFAVASFNFDAAKFFRQHAHDHTPPAMRLADFTSAATDSRVRAELAGTSVRLEGFVDHYQGAVTINRFFIACCVADAALLSAKLDGDWGDLPNDSWIEIVARLDSTHSPSAAAITNGALASLHVISLRRISQPSKPYDYLYG